MHSKLLIDSHVLIWLLYQPEKIGPQAREHIVTADRVYISVVSLWELALKFKKHKLPHETAKLVEGIEALGLSLLRLELPHITTFVEVQLGHGDPFDAMLLAQSKAEDCTLLTDDSALLQTSYPTFQVGR